jgi:hypothetical protein
MVRQRTGGRESNGGISLALAAVIGSAAFLLGLFAADALSQGREIGASAQPARAVRPAPELPRKWVWDREAVNFDDMFVKN